MLLKSKDGATQEREVSQRERSVGTVEEGQRRGAQ